MAEENQSKFDILKIIPSAIAVAILSQVSVVSYYNNFNFSPINYLEAYELVIASTKDFIFIGMFLMFFYQVTFLLIASEKVASKKIPFKSAIRRKFKFIRFSYAILALFGVLILITLFSGKVNSSNVNNIIAVIWVFLSYLNLTNMIFYKTLIRLKRGNSLAIKKYFPVADPILLQTVLLIGWAVIAVSIHKAEYIILQNPYKGTELHLENETIKCTSKVIFIGKSQKYYFIYNTPDRSVRVVKRDDLKKEVIKIDPNVNFFYRF